MTNYCHSYFMFECKITNDLNELKDDWNNLLTDSDTATVFQTPGYLSAWCDSFIADKNEIFLVGVYTEEKLIGVAPLRKIGDKLTFLGTDRIGEKGDLVTDFGDLVAVSGREKEVWESVVGELHSQGMKEVELDYLREFSLSYKILSGLGFQSSQMLDNGVPDVSPFLELPKTYEEYLAGLSRKNRHELKRKQRRLEEMGFKIVRSENPSEDILEFIRLHRESTPEKEKFMSDQMAKFFVDMIKNLSADNCVDMEFMEVNGVKVSATLSFLCHNQYWLYNSGFDRNFEFQAVGLLLKAYTIKIALDLGCARYSFLRGNERYKYDLGARDERLYKIIINKQISK